MVLYEVILKIRYLYSSANNFSVDVRGNIFNECCAGPNLPWFGKACNDSGVSVWILVPCFASP